MRRWTPDATPRVVRVLIAISITGAVLASAACGSGGDPSASSSSAADQGSTTTTVSTAPNLYEEQRAAAVTVVLDDLGAALLRGDRTAVAGLLDASAPTAFRDRLMVAADNFGARAADSRGRGSALRPATFRFALAPTEEAEALVAPAVQAKLDAQGSSDSWVAPVELHHALGGAALPGLAEPEIVTSAQLVLARYGDGWKIVGDATMSGGPEPQIQLWGLPGLAALDVPTAGGVSVIASYPGTAATVGHLRRLLPGAVAAVTTFWGSDWPQRAAVVTTGRPAEFEALASGATGPGAAAATVFDRIDTRNRTAVGVRVVLTPQARALREPALGVVLRHELTHVAARTSTAVGAPMWITEGVPEYVGRKGTYRRFADAAPQLADRIIEDGPPGRLPEDAEFAVAGPDSQLAYQSAWSFAAFVAQKWDEPRLRQLYLGVAGTADTARQNDAIRATLGIGRDALVTEWRRWLVDQVR